MSKRKDGTSDKNVPGLRKETLRQIDRDQLARVTGGAGGDGQGSKSSKYCTGR